MRHPITLTASAFALLLLAGPASAESSFVGGIEGMLGFPGGFESDTASVPGESNAANDAYRADDLSTSFGLVPWVEKKLGSVVGVGAEAMFVWMKPDFQDQRRLVLNLQPRLRMSFPIIDKVTFDAFLAGGLSLWFANEVDQPRPVDEFRLGWSLRFGFGGSYAINDAVSAYGHLGWFTTESFGDDIGASMQTVPLCVGLRGNF